MAQLNKFNFIRWYSNLVKDETVNIPRLGVRQLEKIYKPVIVPGELVAFMINQPVLFNSPDFDSWQLNIASIDGEVVEDIGTLAKDVVSAEFFTVHCEFTVPSIISGAYQLTITSGANVLYMSNWLQAINADIADLISCTVWYRNSRNMYAYRWVQFPLFYQKIRLTLSLKEWEPEGTFQQYREVSTGMLRNERYELDQLLKLETYYFDDAAHAAMTVLLACDDIQINGRKYRAKSTYKPNTSDQSLISKGVAELYEVDFSRINKYGLQN